MIVSRYIFAAAALVAGFLLAASAPAIAAPQCHDRETVLAIMAKKYAEVPVAVGVSNSGGLVEVLAAGDGGTWSIIVTSPKGMSCLVAAGEGWRWMPTEEGPGT